MFEQAIMRLNPALPAASARLHAAGRLPAACYVIDLDTVAANTQRLAAVARELGLACLQMTKQIGRNPLVAETVAANGIEPVVAVELAEARVLHRSGRRIGHLGHLVQIPPRDLDEALAMAPSHLTVFGVEQAALAGAAALRRGVVQPLLLRVVGPNDSFFEAQRGGVPLQSAVAAAATIERIDGVRLEGVTSFPCMAFDEKTRTAAATPNLATLIAARSALREAGFEVPVLNAPGISCVATFGPLAAAGATHVEPGSAIIGETYLHADGGSPEIPAMVYVTEVTHLLEGAAYTLGGGFYARGRARTALIFHDNDAHEADVVPIPAGEIDYYGALRPRGGRTPVVGDSVVYAFRSQVFVTRAPVAVVAGVAGAEPDVVGVFSRDGERLRGAAAGEGR